MTICLALSYLILFVGVAGILFGILWAGLKLFQLVFTYTGHYIKILHVIRKYRKEIFND